MVGAGSAARTAPASPGFVACSTSVSCCRPAESVEGFREALNVRPAGRCTVTAAAATGPAARAFPLFASVPLTDPESESDPLPLTSYCQVSVVVAPPASSVPAGEAGAEKSVAATVPVVATVGGGRASRRTAAPPGLLSASANDTRCKPAETLAGVAEAESDNAAGCCTTTVDEVRGTGAMALPLFASLPLARAVKARVPAPDTDQVQTKDRVDPPESMLPAGDAGEARSAAAAPPPLATVGDGGAASTGDAHGVVCAGSVTDTCWSPAETCVGVAAIESDKARA